MGTGIGEPARLQDDLLERRQFSPRALGQHLDQRLLQVGAQRAAQAAVADQHGRVAAGLEQRIVDADLAELVDDHQRVGAFRARQQIADQRRLARAEKAGDDD